MKRTIIAVIAGTAVVLLALGLSLAYNSYVYGSPIALGDSTSGSNPSQGGHSGGGMMGRGGGGYGYGGGMMGPGGPAGGMIWGGEAGFGNYMGQIARAYANGSVTGYMGRMITGAYGDFFASWCDQFVSRYFVQQQAGNLSVTTSNVFVVRVTNYEFYPANFTVPTGTTVMWVNIDLANHTVTSGSEQQQQTLTGLFGSHELGHIQSYSYTFGSPGTFEYFSDGLVMGTVIVTS
jgi:plastocyanin